MWGISASDLSNYGLLVILGLDRILGSETLSTPQDVKTPDELRDVIQGISTRIDEIGVRL